MSVEEKFSSELKFVFNEQALLRFLYQFFETAADVVRQAVQVIEQCRPHREAVALLEQAVALESGEACGLLASLVLYGFGCHMDNDRAFQLARHGADLGDMTATGVLAWCYRSGWGVKEDTYRAFDLASRSASQNNAWGIHILGSCYLNGLGVAQDYGRARELFLQAAEMGHTGAMLAAVQGNNGPKAVEYYERAAQRGYPHACNILAVWYERGLCGLAVDKAKAEALREKGAELVAH